MKYKDFEDFMMYKHCEQFIGSKDCIVDDFPEWLETLSFEEWFDFGDAYKKEV